MCADVGDKLARFALIEFVRELGVATFANAHVAVAIIVDPIVADCSSHSTDVTDVVDEASTLKGETMTDGAAFLSTRQGTAFDAVEL